MNASWMKRCFGTSVVGNTLSIDEQAAKLRLVCDVAGRIRG